MSAEHLSLVERLQRLIHQTDATSSAADVNATPLLDRLDRIDARLHDLSQALAQTLPATPDLSESGATPSQEEVLAAGLATIEKTVSRAGREQLKANTLAEAQLEQFTGALDALRIADSRREAELAALREQSRAARTAARLELVRTLLPVLDGLDEAQRAGQRLLERPAPPPPRAGLFGRRRADQAGEQAIAELRKDMQGWLVGLTFVQQRLLDLLAAEAVTPIEAQGQPFDPRRHLALEAVSASDTLPPGTVAAVLRRGYQVGDTILRHAEVAVTKGETSMGGGS